MKTGLCAKVTTRATIITKDGKRYIGMNWCMNPQSKCPRKNGEGYEKCESVCGQYGHAEKVACLMADLDAEGGTLYLEGHTYACRNCRETMEKFGISSFVVGPPPPIKGAPPLSQKGDV